MVRAVAARLARAWLARALPAAALGAFTLRSDQRVAAARVLEALRGDGGALLADPPGTGKTIVALAVARAVAREMTPGTTLGPAPDGIPTCVVAPAALREQWLAAARRAGVAIRFVSLESLGRATAVPRAPLLVVDEAHHFRTPSTRRYARLAEGCVGARVLLLTATPVVNRPTDRDALLALFLGSRAAVLEGERLARLVIRREDGDAARPVIRRLPPLDGAADLPGLAPALRALPAPLPAADGRAALALIRLSLAMAWRSGLAALDAALRRRLLRGAALREALLAGRWPDRRDLRRWVLGDDALQLAFPEVAAAPAGGGTAEALRTLDAHCDAVASLRRLVRPACDADTAARAAAIRALRDAHPGRRVVVLAAHADTIRALWSLLRHDAGTVAVTGSRVRAAAGRWTRAEVLAALGPRAGPLRAGDPRAIRLLLATDLLAEGVELQGAGILVHADRAWTPARHEQREGRIARAGAAAPEVLVTRFRAPRGAAALVRLGARLARKARARREAVADADAATRVERMLQYWARGPIAAGVRVAVVGAPSAAAVSAAPAVRPAGAGGGRSSPRCFLALVRQGDVRELVAGRRIGSGWRLGRSAPALLRVLRRIGRSMRSGAPAAERRDAARADEAHEDVRVVRRLLATDLRRRAARALLGEPDGGASLRRRAAARLDAAVARAAPVERASWAVAGEAVLAQAFAARGIGGERRLARTLRTGAFTDAITDVITDAIADGTATAPREARGAPRAGPTEDATEGDAPRPRLVALLVLAG